jgi:hypothetical protein
VLAAEAGTAPLIVQVCGHSKIAGPSSCLFAVNMCVLCAAVLCVCYSRSDHRRHVSVMVESGYDVGLMLNCDMLSAAAVGHKPGACYNSSRCAHPADQQLPELCRAPDSARCRRLDRSASRVCSARAVCRPRSTPQPGVERQPRGLAPSSTPQHGVERQPRWTSSRLDAEWARLTDEPDSRG